MVILCIASWDEAAGKTAFCASLGKRWQEKGQKVGFLKPLTLLPEPAVKNGLVDQDVAFLKGFLGLEEPAESLCPVALTREELLTDTSKAWLNSAKAAAGPAACGKDVLLVEGLHNLGQDDLLLAVTANIVETLPCQVLLVKRGHLPVEERQVALVAEKLAGRLLGVVLNAVPRSGLEKAQKELAPLFERKGIKVLGIVPEDRLLVSPSLGELARHLEGEFLLGHQFQNNLVESLMVGTLVVDPGPAYFGRQKNKAVLVRGDRPDMQLAALDTSVCGLFLTEGKAPLREVLYKAEDRGVPVVSVKKNTLASMEALEAVLAQTRCRQEAKVARMRELLAEHLDLTSLDRQLGLAV